MTLDELFNDKTNKTKQKVETVSNWLTDGSLRLDELIVFAEKSKDVDKASCIESIEFATRKNLNIIDEELLLFATKMLSEKAPRIKWESAKVIGNIAGLFPTKLDNVIEKLMINTNDDGTVVRWATAFALGEIIKLKTNQNAKLLPFVKKIIDEEKDNAIKKKYIEAVKKATR
jgi:HEAT repeat protein